MPLRHFCPSCKKRLVLRPEFGSKNKLAPWYKLSPVRNYCTSCGTEVTAVIRTRAWGALFTLIVLCTLPLLVILQLNDAHTIAPRTYNIALLTLTVILYSG